MTGVPSVGRSCGLGALAGGVDRGVLEQQRGVGQGAVDDLGVHLALGLPALLVVDEVGREAEVHETHGHHGTRRGSAPGLRVVAVVPRLGP